MNIQKFTQKSIEAMQNAQSLTIEHGNQQMERGVVMEFGLRNLHVGGEPLGHMKESVLCVHCIRW